jgi:hypothetical protein
MKRRVTLVTLMMSAALLASLPVWAAPPFGSFGGKIGGGNSGAGLLPLTGWALDDDGVEAVDILVDGFVAARANYHRNRPRVAVEFPGYPDSQAAGWAISLDTTHFLNGNHTITPRILSLTGETTLLPSLVFEFNNVTHNLVPFGKLEFPKHQAELRGNCNLADPARRYNVVSGYALDTGVQQDDTGVGYVELEIDRSLFLNSRNNCFYDASQGGFTNCYGLRRLDLEPLFPGLVDTPHSGFRYVLDVGVLIAGGFYLEGPHLLTIRAGDHFGQVTNIDEISVTFICDENLGNEQGIGDVDQPTANQMLSGFALVSGFALDWEGISTVQVLIDGAPAGTATIHLPRAEISTLYLGYPQSAAPGWELLVDTRGFSNGPHEIEGLITDVVGSTTVFGRRRIVINNPSP